MYNFSVKIKLHTVVSYSYYSYIIHSLIIVIAADKPKVTDKLEKEYEKYSSSIHMSD